MRKDDGISNVVAMMLLLSVLVICIAVLSSSYIPDLKENAEAMHSEDVKEAFLRFGSDVDELFTTAQGGVYTQVFSLGGGDVLLSPSKSGGTVEIQTVNIDTVAGHTITSVNVTYTPLLPYWEKQGYLYENGVVWVTKDSRKIPVQSGLNTTDAGYARETETKDAWISAMQPKLIGDSGEMKYYIQNIVILSADENKTYLSGTSLATLRITATNVTTTTTTSAEGKTTTTQRVVKAKVSIE
ncbi:MAG: hypothetical protein E7Z71_01800 [Methanocorpusculum parvum]|nr:hypothetical protein [Methanocorpusculum parvum]